MIKLTIVFTKQKISVDKNTNILIKSLLIQVKEGFHEKTHVFTLIF